MTASIFSGVHSFFHSGTWSVIELGLIAFVVVFWLATVFWVWKDAHRRIEAGQFVVAATLLGAVPPFVGPVIYMLFRPPEYLDDVRERELEIRAIESRLGASELNCTVCGCAIEHDFLVCPVCTTKLRSACGECARPLEPAWQVCPYCETPVPVGDRVALKPRAPRRRTSSSSTTPSSG